MPAPTCPVVGCVVQGDHDAHYTAEYLAQHKVLLPDPARLVDFELSNTGTAGVFMLGIVDMPKPGTPADLVDAPEVYLLHREDLQALEALIHKALYPQSAPSVEKFEVG